MEIHACENSLGARCYPIGATVALNFKSLLYFLMNDDSIMLDYEI